MLLRDPVHGLVVFEGKSCAIVEKLLDAREVQRLRRVRQLGLTSYVFPGAEHSRLAHALGTAHVMTRLQTRILAQHEALPAELRMTEQDAEDAMAAAFLHDLGHGPFSHLFEEISELPKHHEEWTSDIILDASTDVNRVLRSTDPGLAERVVSILNGTHRLGYLSRAVSGTLDVDRCDYLLRDSYMTGVRYGEFDLEWLFRALCFASVPTEQGEEWVLAIEGRKGLPPIETFFLARQFMYHQVYHHKTTRAAEMLVRAIFLRVAELVRDGQPPPNVPRHFAHTARGESVSLGDYLELDDAVMYSCFYAWEKSSDPELAQLCGRLLSRNLPKTLPLPEDASRHADWQEAHARACEVATAAGFRPSLHVFLDVPQDVPYSEPTENSANGLWVRLRHQPVQRLGDASFLLGQLRGARVSRPRLLFPSEIREDVERVVEEVIA